MQHQLIETFPDGTPNPTFKGAQSLALLTAILELGAFVGALMAGPLADIYSRKVSCKAIITLQSG